MSEINDGGAAFPLPDQYTPDGCPVMQGSCGMSLRAYAAVHAMAGILTSFSADSPELPPPASAAFDAVRYADALIRQLERGR